MTEPRGAAGREENGWPAPGYWGGWQWTRDVEDEPDKTAGEPQPL